MRKRKRPAPKPDVAALSASVTTLTATVQQLAEKLDKVAPPPPPAPTQTLAELVPHQSAFRARNPGGRPPRRRFLGIVDDSGTLKTHVPTDGVVLEVADGRAKVVRDPDEKKEVVDRSLAKSLNLRLEETSVSRLGFTSDPLRSDLVQGIWRPKITGLPDNVQKRIARQDLLVACIVHGRGHQMATHGMPRRDRHNFGYVVELTKATEAKLGQKEREELQPEIDRAVNVLYNCGTQEGWDRPDRCTLSRWLYESVRDGLICGRFATEIIRSPDALTKQMVFRGWRTLDVATVYPAAARASQENAQAVREQSRQLLELAQDKQLDPERFEQDFWDGKFRWVQVSEGRPMQVFTDRECVVTTLYPATDWELAGFPVSPIETAIVSILTHLNIGTWNKKKFESGRATPGMLVIKAEDAGPDVTEDMKQAFNASFNGAANAWRMPIFGIAPEESIEWVPFDSGTRDMEFQYLSDQNAREILSAYQMSPEELPGYTHLSRGTNNQSLAEGNREYQLEAHRDLGIRPLIRTFETFLTQEILPLVSPKLAGKCEVRLLGLEAETPEKESVRLTQDMVVHMTYDEVLERVEKKVLGRKLGGAVPFNAQWRQQADILVPVGRQLALLVAENDEERESFEHGLRFAYLRDSFYWQQQESLMQQLQLLTTQMPPSVAGHLLPQVLTALWPTLPEEVAQQAVGEILQQAQLQQQMAQQQAQQGGGGGGPPPDGGGAAGPPQEQPQDGQEGDPGRGGLPPQQGELGQAVADAQGAVAKSEAQLPRAQAELLRRHKGAVTKVLLGLKTDSRAAILKLLSIAERTS